MGSFVPKVHPCEGFIVLQEIGNLRHGQKFVLVHHLVRVNLVHDFFAAMVTHKQESPEGTPTGCQMNDSPMILNE